MIYILPYLKVNMKSNFMVIYGEEPLGYLGAGFYLNVCSRHSSTFCPKYGNESNTVYLYLTVTRVSFNETPVYFMLIHRRFYCVICDHTFMERIGISLYTPK